MSTPFYPPFEETPESRYEGARKRIENLEKRPPRAKAVLAIKLFWDDEAVEAGDQAIQVLVSRDMDGMRLVDVETYVTTVGSSATTVQLHSRLQAVDLLTTRVTIDSGVFNSVDSGVQPVIDPDIVLAHGDHVRVDVDAAGSGSKGLGIVLTFRRSLPAPVTA